MDFSVQPFFDSLRYRMNLEQSGQNLHQVFMFFSHPDYLNEKHLFIIFIQESVHS
jgi:hypothetical protein